MKTMTSNFHPTRWKEYPKIYIGNNERTYTSYKRLPRKRIRKHALILDVFSPPSSFELQAKF